MKNKSKKLVRRSVLQDWVMELPLMQQSVLIAAMRGPDGCQSASPAKPMLRWFRRCVMVSAFDGCVLDTPWDSRGGSYTGPSCGAENTEQFDEGSWEGPMNDRLREFMKYQDALPHHFVMHFIHAAEIVGYKHASDKIGDWWSSAYMKMCKDFHMHFETSAELDARLNDSERTWRSDDSRFKI